jgi:hypothetical protein
MTVKITPNDRGTPPGQLADAEKSCHLKGVCLTTTTTR